MARFCDDGVCLCRHPSVLLPPAEGTESYTNENRSTTVGMDRVEGYNSTNSSKTSDANYGGNSQSSTGTPEFRRGTVMLRMQPVLRRTV